MTKPQMDLFTSPPEKSRIEPTVTPQPVAGHDHPDDIRQHADAEDGPRRTDNPPVARARSETSPDEDVHNPFAGGGGFDLALPISPLVSHDPFAEAMKTMVSVDEAQIPSELYGGPEPEEDF